MGKFEGWLPFRFRRPKSEDKGGGAQLADAPKQQAGTPAPTAHPLAPLFTTPIASLFGGLHEDPLMRDALSRFSELDRWFGDFSPARYQPTVDVVDEESSLRIAAELPGMTRDDVTLRLDNDMLIIQGEKRNVDERNEHGVYRSERYYGYVKRAVPLPPEVDQDKAEASFQDGVLTVRFPKSSTPRVKQRAIEITG